MKIKCRKHALLLTFLITAVVFALVPAVPALAADTGWKVPSSYEAVAYGGFTTPDKVYASDNVYASATFWQVEAYGTFNFGIPDGSTINGIQVSVEGKRDAGAATVSFRVYLSWNGTDYTAYNSTGDLGASGHDTAATAVILGNSTDKWGRTWAAGDFTNANFRVKLEQRGSTTIVVGYLDQVMVKVNYTYTPLPAPTISTVSPSSGSTAGGTSITITGTNFTGATSVTIGGNAATFSVTDGTHIAATTPAGTAGARDVAVTTPGGTATLTGGFTYVAPLTAGDGTTITGDVGAILELTAPSAISLGNMNPSGSPYVGSSATNGSVKCNDPDGCTVTVESNRADGKMASANHTLTNALLVTTGLVSGAPVTNSTQTCVDTSALGETAISLSVSQTIVYGDAADTGYAITLTYAATAK